MASRKKKTKAGTTTRKKVAKKTTTRKVRSSTTPRASGARKAKVARKTTSRRGASSRARAEVKEAAMDVTAPVEPRTDGAPAPASASFRALGKGVPPPFVVARGEDRFRVLDEALKYAGFFDRIEELLEESGKRREMFEIACKVDFMDAGRKEDPPATYVDPRLVTHLFDQLLDKGFRLLRVVESRNEMSRYQRHRSVPEVGKALGYDESCYELRDLGDELVPVPFGGALGTLPAGRIWHAADCRILFAKNRTDEHFGPALLFYNVFHALASPTSVIAMEKGLDPGAYVVQSLNEHPAHFGLIDAIFSQDGSPGSGGPYDLLTDPDGTRPTGPAVLQTNTILAGQDLLAVEAAGWRMQGQDPMTTAVFKMLRKNLGYKPPAEVEDLPLHQGWRSLGAQIREMLDLDRPVDTLKLGLWQRLKTIDPQLFPPQPGAFQHVRLQKAVEQFLADVCQRRGIVPAGTAAQDQEEADEPGF